MIHPASDKQWWHTLADLYDEEETNPRRIERVVMPTSRTASAGRQMKKTYRSRQLAHKFSLASGNIGQRRRRYALDASLPK